MNSFDLSIFNFLHAAADKWFLLDWLAILFAVYVGYAMLAFFVIMLVNERDRKKRAYAFVWWLLTAIAARGVVAQTIYFFYHRPRPFVSLGIEPVFDHAAVSSFPSGHMAFYGALVAPMWYLNRKWGMIYAGLIVAMGIARVYGAVHWPTDILAGIVLAIGAAYGVKYLLFGKMQKEEKESKETE